MSSLKKISLGLLFKFCELFVWLGLIDMISAMIQLIKESEGQEKTYLLACWISTVVLMCVAFLMSYLGTILPLKHYFMGIRVGKAKNFAKKAHAGQMYGKEDYMYHLEGVASEVDSYRFRNKRNLKVLAYLHDVLEDTNTKADDIRKIFGPNVLYKLMRLTKKAGEDHINYFKRIAVDSDCRKIKMLDRLFNVEECVKGLSSNKTYPLKTARRYIREYDSFSKIIVVGDDMRGLGIELDLAHCALRLKVEMLAKRDS